MIVRYMHKYAIYALLLKICQELRANFAIKQLIDISSILDRELSVNSLKLMLNNVAPNVVKPPLVQWLVFMKKVPAAVAVINESE